MGDFHIVVQGTIRCLRSDGATNERCSGFVALSLAEHVPQWMGACGVCGMRYLVTPLGVGKGARG